jgi:release factor glutamine methyltransferase
VTIDGESLRQWYGTAKDAALAAAVDGFELDWLLGELLGLDRLSLRLGSFPALVEGDLAALEDLWEQRLGDRIPVQYLVGHVHWRGMRLKVSPAVLIPRPETELLIDLVSDVSVSGPWVDLGTGSGAIALGLAQALPSIEIHGVDCSEAALDVARENAGALGFGDRITFYQGSWCGPIAHLEGKLAGFLSNPPYIPSREVDVLQPEVLRHEPRLALDGGRDGLDAIRQLVAEGSRYLRSGGIWAVELMAGQGETVANLLRAQGNYEDIRIERDWADWDRFVLARRC